MRTIVDIDDDLQAKVRDPEFDLPVSTVGGGIMPEVDFSKHSALLDLMEDDDLKRDRLSGR